MAVKMKSKRKRIGKTLKSATADLPQVQLHLVVTRRSGDTERYKLGEVADMIQAADYRRKLIKVAMPKAKRLRKAG